MNIQVKKIKTIFSVLASPSRLEILRILAAKGSMSYSELKEQSGFRPKKESGKFAYHLKKLVQQSLITQNRSEKRYMLSPLGRLVLSLSKQIEEQSVIESGRLYVRESSQRMEEFDPAKIIQSLVKEANMSLDAAQKIADEAESRIYRFQLTYLTAPLIREMVNSILLEEGKEQYWRKLTRVGMPVYDINQLLESTGRSEMGQEELIFSTSKHLFSEYLMHSSLPSDLIDAHLNGDVHLPNTDQWLLKPDVIELDLNTVDELMAISGSKTNPLTNRNGKLALISVVNTLSREAAREIYLKGANNFLKDDDPETTFRLLSLSMPSYHDTPVLTLELESADKMLIEAYNNYCYSVKEPKIFLAFPSNVKLNAPKWGGGYLITDGSATISGARFDSKKYINIIMNSISINAPRLAYDSHNDRMYFMARALMLMEIVDSAVNLRLKTIASNINNGLLPTLNSALKKHPADFMRALVNIVGLREASAVFTEGSDNTAPIKEQIIGGLQARIRDKMNDTAYISYIKDDGNTRLAQLDQQKLGKGRVSISKYSEGYTLDGVDGSLVKEVQTLSGLLEGGLSVELISNKQSEERGWDRLNGINGYVLLNKMVKCAVCGWVNPPDAKTCRHCNIEIKAGTLR